MYAEGQQQHIVDRARREGRVDATDPAADAAICSAEVDAVDEVRKLTDGRGVDDVITAACGTAQEDALQMAAPSGRIGFFGGLPNDKPTIKLDSNLVHYRELTIVDANCSSPAICPVWMKPRPGAQPRATITAWTTP